MFSSASPYLIYFTQVFLQTGAYYIGMHLFERREMGNLEFEVTFLSRVIFFLKKFLSNLTYYGRDYKYLNYLQGTQLEHIPHFMVSMCSYVPDSCQYDPFCRGQVCHLQAQVYVPLFHLSYASHDWTELRQSHKAGSLNDCMEQSSSLTTLECDFTEKFYIV